MTTPPARLTRRDALRLIGGSTLALAGTALLLPDKASAGRVWCRADPTFRVDGIVGNVYVSGEVDRVYDVTGPIQLRFIAPHGTVVELLASDGGFGQGYDIVYANESGLRNDDSRIALKIEVVVPAAGKRLPVLVEFVPDGTIQVADKHEGRTNEKIRVDTELRKPQQTKSGKGDGKGK